jgi:hypothetical protein
MGLQRAASRLDLELAFLYGILGFLGRSLNGNFLYLFGDPQSESDIQMVSLTGVGESESIIMIESGAVVGLISDSKLTIGYLTGISFCGNHVSAKSLT